MKRFIRKLMRKMSIDEKIGQLNLAVMGNTDTGTAKSLNVSDKIAQGNIGAIFGLHSSDLIYEQQRLAVENSRLKIPLMFGFDVIHGHRTVFPIPLGLSCTWDMELITKTARAATKEATEEGINWLFSPMVDISRDPRWGRVCEGSGEDSYLGSCIAKAMVNGIQGDKLSSTDTALACVKHFALYGAAEGGRDYNTVDMSYNRMYQDYFPPYKSAIESGAASVMTAFNDINGTPSSGNKWLLTEVLRNKWGFEGLTVTDYTAINEMVSHGLGNLRTVSALALNAGVDMDMVGEGFLTTLKKSLQKKEISESDINRACQRVLEAKYKLGLFKDPYKYLSQKGATNPNNLTSHRALAKESAAKSCVLLKNSNATLPLNKSDKIALIGPLADDKRNVLGSWSIAGDWQKAISVLEGIKGNLSAKGSVTYAKGSNITEDEELAKHSNFAGQKVIIDKSQTPGEMIKEAKKIAKDSDIIVAVVGEAQEMSGECASRTNISLPKEQKKLLKALSKLDKPLVIVVMGGRPLDLSKEEVYADAILYSWFGGLEAGNGISSVLFGDHNPSGKLTMSFPRNVGQIPIYYNYKATGRPLSSGKSFEKFKSCYLDTSNKPLFPFGFGLSYTNFEYSPIVVNKTKLKGERENLVASVNIKNTGELDGEETVQLYISDRIASTAPAVKSLKGFQKVFIKAGEEKKITFTISTEDLKFYNSELQHIWEPGEFVIHISPSSEDAQSIAINWAKDNNLKRSVYFKKTSNP